MNRSQKSELSKRFDPEGWAELNYGLFTAGIPTSYSLLLLPEFGMQQG